MKSMSINNDHEGIFDKLADIWSSCGTWAGRRPAQLLGYFVAALILVGVATYAGTRITENSHRINAIKAQFCGGAVDTPHNTSLCQQLFNKLLEHPTREQVIRLKQLIKESK
jgi:uncharacterized membrane protein YiaA